MNKFFDSMTYVSRFTIIMPVIVIVIAVIFYFSDSISNLRVLNAKQTVTPTPTKAAVASVAKKEETEPTIDLKGPSSCVYSTPEATFSAKIKNERIYVEKLEQKKASHYLLNGDCFYSWDAGNAGVKYCGIGQYMSMFKMLSGMGMMNVGTILGYLPQLGLSKSVAPNESAIKDILKSCKKNDIAESIFIVPQGVVFSTKALKP